MEPKLRHLAQLQSIDSQLDELIRLRGDLPAEIAKLTAEIEALEGKSRRGQETLRSAESERTRLQTDLVEGREKIEKYKQQQFNVRNNREYDALTKEIDAKTREMESAESRLRELTDNESSAGRTVSESGTRLDEVRRVLDEKETELKSVIAETAREEDDLLAERKKLVPEMDPADVQFYERIRGAKADGKAVVPLRRGACGGCFKVVPPQRQVEIRQINRQIACEFCGRVLVPEELMQPA